MVVVLFVAGLFSIHIGSGWFFHNDGVTIVCSQKSFLALLHPGNRDIIGCSFDHQPLFHYIVKLIGPIFNYNILSFEILNLILVSASVILVFHKLYQRLNFLPSLAASLFFYASFSVLYFIQDLRMYCLYLLTSTVIIISYLENREKEDKLSLINAFIGYFNFYLFIIPLGSYIAVQFNQLKSWSIPKKALLVILFICILIKTPYVFIWRAIERAGGETYTSVPEILRDIIWGTDVYMIIGWLVFAISLFLWIKSFTWNRKNIFVTIQLSSIAILLFTFISILNSHEIRWRYFHFFYPISTWLLAELFIKINSRKIQNAIALLLIIVSTHNCINMFQRDMGKGLEIKKSAQELKKAIKKDYRFAIDNTYFFENYWLIYAEILGAKKPRFKEINLEYQRTEDSFDAFASNFSNEEQHQKLCERALGSCKTIWNEENFLGFRTMISISASEP
jgi:hypothetical protein